MDFDRLLKYVEYPRERDAIDAVSRYGSARAAEAALGLGNDTIGKAFRRVRVRADNAARIDAIAPRGTDGFVPRELTTAYDSDGNELGSWIREGPTPSCQPGGEDEGPARDGHSGYVIKGVSTYFDAAGNQRGQWVKTKIEDSERAQALRDFAEELATEYGFRAKSPLPAKPVLLSTSVLTVYKFGDPHFGMESSVEAGGDDFDLDDADRLTRAAIDRLVMVAPSSAECILEVIGDAVHANDSSALTPGHKNPLDVDRRGFAYALMRTARAWVYAVLRLLEKHETVIVWFLEGNHDPDASAAIALMLALHFDNNPRVKIDTSRAVFRYHRFGKCLLGAHHGDKVKMHDLPLLMAVDRPEDWGATEFRYIDTGHIHHDVVKEIQGVRVESLRTLAAKDPYHAMKGYRALRDTRAVVYHEEYGECERYTVSAAMLEEAKLAA